MRVVHFFVTCMLVMGCGNIERCRLAERVLLQRGIQIRSATQEGGNCTGFFVREHTIGEASGVLNEVCQELEAAISAGAHDRKAFVPVVGTDTAWATLEAGRPTLRGTSRLPQRT